MIKKWLKGIVKNLMAEEYAVKEKELETKRQQVFEEASSVLGDITYRTTVLRETADRQLRGETRIHTADLNLATHLVDGYVFTNNSPAGGSVAWADLNITYKGSTYTITNGNTANKYIWWDFDAVPNTALQSSNTKPTLTADDILIGINDGGTFHITFVPGKVGHGASLKDNTIGTGEIKDGSITSQLLGSGAVTSAKIAAGAVTSSAIASGAVGSSAIAANAVTGTQLASGAVTSAKIAAGAVTANELGAGAVTSAKIGSGAVTGDKIGAGSIAESKLNLATHFIF